MESDRLYNCALSYTQINNYEYKIKLYNGNQINEVALLFNKSHFMHLSGLEKLRDIINPSEISSRELCDKILNKDITYSDITDSDFWNASLNDPQTNNVTYTLEDRIETLTNFHSILNNCSIKAYSWNPNCHSSYRPYSSEINADFMLVFESDNKKTSDERIYAFFKFDKNNPNIAHGVSQFPTDRTYNDDGRRSVPEITIMSVIEHDKVDNVDRVIMELSAEEQQRLIEKSLKNSEYATIKLDLKQLKSKRTKYIETNTEASQKAYEKRLSIFSNKNVYSEEMLKSVIDRLMSQAQDPNNKQAHSLILKEIERIKNELAIREKNTELPSGIQIAKCVYNNNGTISAKETVATIKIPPFVNKAESAIKRAAHFVAVSAADIVSNIKNTFSKPNKKAPPKKAVKRQTVSSKPKSVQSVKSEIPVQSQEQEKEKIPMFSIAELQSDKYAPTSSKDKNIGRTKKNDLDL